MTTPSPIRRRLTDRAIDLEDTFGQEDCDVMLLRDAAREITELDTKLEQLSQGVMDAVESGTAAIGVLQTRIKQLEAALEEIIMRDDHEEPTTIAQSVMPPP